MNGLTGGKPSLPRAAGASGICSGHCTPSLGQSGHPSLTTSLEWVVFYVPF